MSRYGVNTMRAIQVLILLLACCPVLLLTGCTEGGPAGGGNFGQAQGGSDTGNMDTRWPFWPQQMRLHPLTMVTEDADSAERFIEARVEFVDQFGDTTKCVGSFRFELFPGDPSISSDNAVREWNIDLLVIEANQLHYDRVTRTYLFRLALDDQMLDGRQHLRVQVVSSNEREFTSAMKLR